MQKRTIATIGVTAAAVMGIGAWLVLGARDAHAPSSNATAPSNSTNSQALPAPTTGTFHKAKYSTTESSSLWVIASKKRPLAKGYAPAKLVVPNVPLRLSGSEEQMKVSSVIAAPLETMVAAAGTKGIKLKLSSGYRSEATHTLFYNNYIAKDGQEAADRYSAKPGTSEHQTGLAVDMIAENDICHLEVCFANTPEGSWLGKHAHEYGFIIRYLDGKESETSYQYEPWHIRYVGNELADELYKNGQTMEAFFGLLN